MSAASSSRWTLFPRWTRSSVKTSLRGSPRLLRRLCLATLVANVTIVVTGGLVRLTASGLGCPTWPRCTNDSYVTTPENGLHGYLEFGNRMLTFAVGAVVITTLLVAWLQRPRRRSLVGLAAAQLLGVAGQAALGGVTVLTGLNPWTVAAHFLLSMILIYGAFALWWRSKESDRPPVPLVAAPLRGLLRAIATTTAVALVLGTVVTGSGPHSGGGDAPGIGLGPAVMSQLHADAVLLLIGLSVGAWFAAHAVAAPLLLQRLLGVHVLAELAQGGIGLIQYLTDLPIALVSAHMLGACLVWVTSVAVLFAARSRESGIPETRHRSRRNG